MITLDDDMVLTERDAVLLAGHRDRVGYVELALTMRGVNPSTGRPGVLRVRCFVLPQHAAWAREKMAETPRHGVGRINKDIEIEEL